MFRVCISPVNDHVSALIESADHKNVSDYELRFKVAIVGTKDILGNAHQSACLVSLHL